MLNLAFCRGSLFFAVVAIFSISVQSPAQENDRSLAVRHEHGELVFYDGFESKEWFRKWGARQKPPRAEIVASDPERKFEPHTGKALRIRIDEGGHYGVSLAYRFQQQLGSEPEEIYFRYDLRLADDWSPAGGGKLPGIAGTYGRAGWGGRRVNGRDGWSARGLFEDQRDGKTPIGFYCYHAEMRGRYGSHWVWDQDNRGFLENNRWYAIQQYVKLNSPGKNDGVLRGWVDGELAFEKTDVRFRDVETLKIETVWLDVYFGGSQPADSAHHLYLDNAAISRQTIDFPR